MVDFSLLQRAELNKFPHVNLFMEILEKDYPFLVGAVRRQISEFGAPLMSSFEDELLTLFGADTKDLKCSDRLCEIFSGGHETTVEISKNPCLRVSLIRTGK